ncbi:MAG: hypothetical protein OXF84_00655 [Bacteroidetes bacterium]|nr:hypothetical protein [Bacteroidota bacterium]
MTLLPSNPVEGSQKNTKLHGTSSKDAQQLGLFDLDLSPSSPSPTPPRQADYPNLLRGREGVKAKPKPLGFGRPLTEEELEAEKTIFNNSPKISCTSVHGYLRDWAEKYTTPTSSSGKVLRFLVERVRHTPTDPNYLKCWPKRSVIAQELALSEETIKRAIAALTKQKLIGVRKGQRGNFYTLFPGQILKLKSSEIQPNAKLSAGSDYRESALSAGSDYREFDPSFINNRRGTEEIIGASAYDSKKMTPFQREAAKHAGIDHRKIQQRMPWIKHHLNRLEIYEGSRAWEVGTDPQYSDAVEYFIRRCYQGDLAYSLAKTITSFVDTNKPRELVIQSARGILEEKNCFASDALQYIYKFPYDTIESFNIDNYSFLKGKELTTLCRSRCAALNESFPVGYGTNYTF